MKINLSKSKELSFTTAGVKNPLNFKLRDEKILEDSFSKY
jgi:hypothetical protein